MREYVESFDDPRLDDYRNIPDRELLAEGGIFVAEGRLVVTRLLAAERFTVRSLMLTRVAADALATDIDARPDLRCFEVSQETMNRVAGFNMHRGCLAIGKRPTPLEPAALLGRGTTLVALEGVGNADNVGSIFRNAAAFGAGGVLLDNACADPLYRKALRTSMGAALRLPFARTERWLSALDECRSSGMTLIGLKPSPDASPIRSVAASLAGKPVVLVLGHEGDGLTSEALAACDVCVRIPMSQDVDSLNVATAAAIALYEFSGNSTATGT